MSKNLIFDKHLTLAPSGGQIAFSLFYTKIYFKFDLSCNINVFLTKIRRRLHLPLFFCVHFCPTFLCNIFDHIVIDYGVKL